MRNPILITTLKNELNVKYENGKYYIYCDSTLIYHTCDICNLVKYIYSLLNQKFVIKLDKSSNEYIQEFINTLIPLCI